MRSRPPNDVLHRVRQELEVGRHALGLPRFCPAAPGRAHRVSDRRGCASRSAPVTPSMVEWWILVTKPTLPFSRPSRRCSSHSGRLRSSGMLAMSATTSASSRMVPGDRTAPRWMCVSRSKSGSSIQTGWPRSKGTGTSRRRKGGSRCSRVRMMWTMRSNEKPSPSDGSRITTPTTLDELRRRLQVEEGRVHPAEWLHGEGDAAVGCSAAVDADAAPRLADHVAIETVGQVREGDAGDGISPRQLSARAVVSERGGALPVAEAARRALAVVAVEHETDGAVGGDAEQRIGERVAHVRRRDGEPLRDPTDRPDCAAALGRRARARTRSRRHRRPARPPRSHRAVERLECFVGHFADIDAGHAEDRLQLLRRRRLARCARRARCRPAGPRVRRAPSFFIPSGSSTRRRSDSVCSQPSARASSSASTQCAVVAWYSWLRAGFPVEPPLRERSEAAVARVPLRWTERRAREARRVQQHLFDGDDVLAVRAELGDVVGDTVVERDRALGEELPDRRRHDGLRGRVDRVPGGIAGRCVAERRPPGRSRPRRRGPAGRTAGSLRRSRDWLARPGRRQHLHESSVRSLPLMLELRVAGRSSGHQHSARSGVTGPLDGVKVVELASIGPIPFCGLVLSDMGADVVRVDKPVDVATADPSRAPGTVLDRGRRSIGVDLKSPRRGGRAATGRVRRRADRGVPARRRRAARHRSGQLPRAQSSPGLRPSHRVGTRRTTRRSRRARHRLHRARRAR